MSASPLGARVAGARARLDSLRWPMLSGPAPFAQAGGAAAVYLLFAAYVTWPVATDIDRIFYSNSGDPLGTMGFYRELVEGGLSPFAPGRLEDFNAPEGQPIQWILNLAAMPNVAAFYLLTWTLGEVAAVGIYTFAGFTLSGLSLFLLARRLGASPWAALVAGWAFAFYPFAIVKAQGHWEFAHGWPLVIAVWRLIALSERPGARNGVWAGLAVCLAMWWTPYYILLGGVSYAVIALVSLLLSSRRRQLRMQVRGQLAAALVVGVFLAGLAGLALSGDGSTSGLRTNDVTQLNTYSARPLEYVVPPGLHPIFGEVTGPFLRSRNQAYNQAESTLYVGVTVILLALLGVVAAVRDRLAPAARRAALLIGAMSFVALLSSAPPQGTLAGVTIPFPSYFISELTTSWRVYARFVVVVMLGLALLAALGLTQVTRGRSRAARLAILIAASLLIPIDLWTERLAKRTDQTTPVYSALRQLPEGRVAEYPLVPSTYSDYWYLWTQKYHGKPMINGYRPDGSNDEQSLLSLSALDEPATAARLAHRGVSYVVVRNRPPGYGLAGPGKPTRHFKLVSEDQLAALYRLDPNPRVSAAAPAAGFGARERDKTGTFRWLSKPSGTLEVIGPCSPCRGTLTMRLLSFAQPRVVSLTDARGRVIARRRVVGETMLRAPLRFDRRTRVRVSATPGPQSIREISGGNDPRSVSVQLRDFAFRARPANP